MTALLAQAGSSREWYDGWQLTALMSIAFALYATLLALVYKRMSKVNQTENRADPAVTWGKTFYGSPNKGTIASMQSDKPSGYDLSLVKTEEGGFVCHLKKGINNTIASFSVSDDMGSVMADVDRAVLEDYKIQQGKAAETENQVSSVFAGATRADWVAKSET